MWNIGNISIDSRIVAAPLAGISNPVYRSEMRKYGAGLVVSEMISDKALHYQNARTFDMCRVDPNEHPVALQLFGGDPVTMAEASEYLTKQTPCDIVDINMGCPVAKVIKAHAGSYLMQHEDLAVEIAAAVVQHTTKPVTVKMRAGWDSEHINCDSLARRLEAVGVSAIAIHGRTRGQFYEGHSQNRYIKLVKDAVSIPVIGNGDIRSVEDAKRMFEETGVDAVMVGRGLLGRPFFLQELRAELEGGTFTMPSYEERIELCKNYATRLCEDQSEYVGIRMMRGMGTWYLTGMPHASAIKNAMCSVESLQDFYTILEDYAVQLKQK